MPEYEANVVPETEPTFRISEPDLDELDVIAEMVLRAHQNKSTEALFTLYQRIKHISVRTRGIFQE